MPQVNCDSTKFDAINVVDARIPQARAVVQALMLAYNDKDGFQLAENYLHDALWAVEELLDQAIKASKVTSRG